MKLMRFLEVSSILFTNVVGRYRLEDPKVYDVVLISAGEFSYYHADVCRTIQYYLSVYSHARIIVGGVYASVGDFTWVEDAGGVVVRGTVEALDLLQPAYEYYAWNRVAYVFTTRGCTRSCDFCHVSRVEPDYGKVERWEIQVPNDFKTVMIHDNNIWSFGSGWFARVCDTILNRRWKVIFDNGFDCRLTSTVLLHLLRALCKEGLVPPTGIRLAYDSESQNGPCQDTIKRISSFYDSSQIMVYVLAGHAGTPAILAMERAYAVYACGARPVIQSYLPLDWAGSPEKYVEQYTGEFSVAGLEKHWNTDMDGYGYPRDKSPEWHSRKVREASYGYSVETE